MNLEELQNFEQEEKDLAKKALRKYKLLGKFDPKFFFEDKICFRETYAVRFDMEIPVKLLLPFYEQLMIPIFPLKSSKAFEKNFGITVEELRTLYRENKVIPLPTGHLYLYDGLDYLMPILEEKPPTMIRMDYAERCFWGSEGIAKKYVIEANAELAGRFKDLAKKYEQISYFKELPRSIEEQLEIESIERYKRLSYFGYNWLAKAISRMEDIASVYYQLGLCNAFLVSPFLVGGFAQYSEQVMNTFKGQKFLVKGEKIGIFEKCKVEPFPIEIARVLLSQEEKRLNLLFPSKIALSDVLALAGDSAFRRAREALSEFYIAVEKELSSEEVMNKKATIDAVWDETREAIESMKTEARVVKWCLWSTCMGIIGPLAASLAGLPGLFSLLEIGVTLNKMIKPEYLVEGIAISSLPMAIYKLERVFENNREKQKG